MWVFVCSILLTLSVEECRYFGDYALLCVLESLFLRDYHLSRFSLVQLYPLWSKLLYWLSMLYQLWFQSISMQEDLNLMNIIFVACKQSRGVSVYKIRICYFYRFKIEMRKLELLWWKENIVRVFIHRNPNIQRDDMAAGIPSLCKYPISLFLFFAFQCQNQSHFIISERILLPFQKLDITDWTMLIFWIRCKVSQIKSLSVLLIFE